MDRRTALRTLAATALVGPAGLTPRSLRGAPLSPGTAPAVLKRRYAIGPQAQEYSARAIRLVTQNPVVDMLCQFRFQDMNVEEPRPPQSWLADPTAFTEQDWIPYRDSGVDVIALGRGAPNRTAALRFMAEWNGFIASHSDWLRRVDDPRDFGTMDETGKLGLMLTFQNSEHFDSVDDVDLFYGLGQKVSQLTYNFQNRLGAGFLEHNDGGLSVFGHRVLERMQEVGMVVDLSHCADRTTLDGHAAATRPVIYTHASCRALLPGFMRCKTDEAIRKLAEGGGVMGIPFIRFMIKDGPPVGVDDVVDHFDHVARLVGVEHVGIGSDLDLEGFGSPRVPPGEDVGPASQPNFERYRAYFTDDGYVHIEGLNHPKRVFDLTEGLIRRGFDDREIGLMLGGNFMRVLSELWS
jgi:membrane dipeptidase